MNLKRGYQRALKLVKNVVNVKEHLGEIVMENAIITEMRRVSVDLTLQEYCFLEELSKDVSIDETIKNAIRFLYWSRGIRGRGGEIRVVLNGELTNMRYF